MSTIDIATLLEPISAAEPVGKDLRQITSADSIYYQVKSARHKARDYERKALYATGDDALDAAADWKLVKKLASEILTKHSKDIEIVTWLIEAQVRLHQFVGLKDGFVLVRKLIEQYWQDIYPHADEDGVTTRVISLIGLNGEDGAGALIAPIHNVPLTDDKHAEPYAYWHYKSALALDKVTDKKAKEKRIADKLAVEFATIQQAANESGVAFYKTLITDIQDCIDEFKALSVILDEKCQQLIPTSNIKNALAACLNSVKVLTKDMQLEESKPESEADLGTDAGLEPLSAAPSSQITTQQGLSREQALQMLQQVASYYRKSEPHSPVSYLLDKAIRWGKLPLPELLKELVHDKHVQTYISVATGVELPANEQ